MPPNPDGPRFRQHIERLKAIRSTLTNQDDIEAMDASIYLFHCIFGSGEDGAREDGAKIGLDTDAQTITKSGG